MIDVSKIMKNVKEFLSQMKNDWRKIVFPSKMQVITIFVISVIMLAICSVAILYVDFIMSNIVKLFLTI